MPQCRLACVEQQLILLFNRSQYVEQLGVLCSAMALQWLIDEAFITDEGSLIELRKALLCEPDQLNGPIDMENCKRSHMAMLLTCQCICQC